MSKFSEIPAERSCWCLRGWEVCRTRVVGRGEHMRLGRAPAQVVRCAVATGAHGFCPYQEVAGARPTHDELVAARKSYPGEVVDGAAT